MKPLEETFRPQVLIIDGVTGTGKSTLLQFIRSQCPAVHVGAKLSDRPRRADDSAWEYRFVQEIPAHLEQTTYKSVGNRYAIDMDELTTALRHGRTYVTTCGHFEVIENLRRRFMVATVYIYRPLTSGDIHSLMQQRGVHDSDVITSRTHELGKLLDDYASGMHIFDFVILNVGTLTQFENQVRAFLRVCGLL